MSCTHDETRARILFERGLPDPHRDTCADCQQAHRAYEVLVRALPRLGATDNDRRWQAAVLQRIDREDRAATGHRIVRWWRIGFGVGLAATVGLIWCLRSKPTEMQPTADRPRIEIITGSVAMRSTSARIGDRVRVSITLDDAVWFYRDELLISRCPAADPACRVDAHGVRAELALAVGGEYQIVIVPARAPTPTGALDRDLANVVSAGARYQLTELSVR